MQLAFWQKFCKIELQATGSLITPERKVPKGSEASQNKLKSKGYPSKTSEAAFTMQKEEKGGKGGFGYAISLLAKNVSKRTTGSLISPERKVPQRSDESQNDHKSKGYPSKTSEAKGG